MQVMYEPPIPVLSAFSDASDTGLGAHVTINNNTPIVYRGFSEFESSTWRDLSAIEFGLASLKTAFLDIKQSPHGVAKGICSIWGKKSTTYVFIIA